MSERCPTCDAPAIKLELVRGGDAWQFHRAAVLREAVENLQPGEVVRMATDGATSDGFASPRDFRDALLVALLGERPAS